MVGASIEYTLNFGLLEGDPTIVLFGGDNGPSSSLFGWNNEVPDPEGGIFIGKKFTLCPNIS